MKICKSLPEAQAVPGVVLCHRDGADDRWIAYEAGDELPKPPEPTARDLIAALEAETGLDRLARDLRIERLPKGASERVRAEAVEAQISALRAAL